MQRTSCRLLILSGLAAALLLVWRLPVSTSIAQGLQGAFDVSFMPGSRDDAGRFMGGTEMRVLAAHAGRLYAGNGYWEDRPGPEGLQGAQKRDGRVRRVGRRRPCDPERGDHAVTEELVDRAVALLDDRGWRVRPQGGNSATGELAVRGGGGDSVRISPLAV
jgi:hypothetical protein